MPLLYETRSKDQNRKEKQKKQLAKSRREIVASENSRVEPKLTSRTLSIVKQGDNYLLNYVDILLKDRISNLTYEQVLSMQAQQFKEALKSLLHNINFVLSAQNMGTSTKKGDINMEYLKNLNFTYNTTIRSNFAYRSINHSISHEGSLDKSLINVLEESQKIVASFDDIIENIKQSDSDLYEKMYDLIDLKVRLLTTSINLITALKNDKINLDEFKNEVYFGTRSTPSTFEY